MKTYNITIAKTFHYDHKRAGQATDFWANILLKIKKHTIRANYQYWRNIAQKFQNEYEVFHWWLSNKSTKEYFIDKSVSIFPIQDYKELFEKQFLNINSKSYEKNRN